MPFSGISESLRFVTRGPKVFHGVLLAFLDVSDDFQLISYAFSGVSEGLMRDIRGPRIPVAFQDVQRIFRRCYRGVFGGFGECGTWGQWGSRGFSRACQDVSSDF